MLGDPTMLDSTRYEDPLDVLRRFVPTPLRTRFRVGSTTILVETNDFSLLPALPLEVESSELDSANFEWKLVRDPDAPGPLLDPLFLSSGQITMVAMGTACVLGMDHERHELLCFIGAEIGSRTFQDVLVPFLCRLSMETVQANTLNGRDELNEDDSDAKQDR